MVVTSPLPKNIGRLIGKHVVKAVSRDSSTQKRTIPQKLVQETEAVTKNQASRGKKKMLNQGKKKVVHTNNKKPTHQTIFNSNYLCLHTNRINVEFDTNHKQQCYIDKNESEYK